MRRGAGRYQREYFERIMGRAAVVDGPVEKAIEAMVDRGAWVIGTPVDCVAGIKRLAEQSGGFGGFMVQTIDWAPRDRMLHSYELLARYVMPQFQGTALGTAASNAWAYDRRELLMAGRTRAIERARKDYAQGHA
jgi:limonene 1,2-monooxygenase